MRSIARLCLLLTFLGVVSSCTPRRGGNSNDDDSVDDDDSGVAADDDDSNGPLVADILFVIDNSASMADEQASLATDFGAFWAGLDGGDYQIGVLTTDVTSSGNGNQGNVRSLGGIGGATCEEPRILRPGDGDVAGDFADLVDVGVGGAGDETGVLAAAFALCKGQDAAFWASLDDRPTDDPVRVVCSLIPLSERATGEQPPCNADATGRFFREGVTPIVIVVSDEGDGASTRNDLPPPSWLDQCVDDNAGDPSVGPCWCRISWFGSFFSSLPEPAVFFSITPSFQLVGEPAEWCDGGTLDIAGPCNEFGSNTCSLELYQHVSCTTGGLYQPLQENVGGVTSQNPPECRDADLEALLTEIAASIAG